jgi:hypothetical protein
MLTLFWIARRCNRRVATKAPGGRMSDDRSTPDVTAAERQARVLAALLDAAAYNVEQYGLVPPR